MANTSTSNKTGSDASHSYHHGDLRRAIKESTLEIIGTDGLSAVSLRAIGRRLGVSEAAPYHHFSSKTELFAVIASESYRGLHVAMLNAITSAGSDPFDRLAALARSYVRYGIESRGRYRLMFGEHMIELAEFEEVVAAGRPTRELLQQVVADCVPGDNEYALTVEHTTWSLVHGVTSLLSEHEIRFGSDTSKAEKLINDSIRMLIAGIRAELA